MPIFTEGCLSIRRSGTCGIHGGEQRLRRLFAPDMKLLGARGLKGKRLRVVFCSSPLLRNVHDVLQHLGPHPEAAVLEEQDGSRRRD